MVPKISYFQKYDLQAFKRTINHIHTTFTSFYDFDESSTYFQIPRYVENRDTEDVMAIMMAHFMICLITFAAKDTYLLIFQSRIK